MPTLALARERLGWLAGLGLLALASHALAAVMGLQFAPTPQISGSPAGMVALLLSLVIDAVAWLLAMKLAVEALQQGLAGTDAPHAEYPVNDGQALRHLGLWMGLLVSAYLLWRLAGGGVLVIYLACVLAMLPAWLSLLTMEDSLLRAFDPRAWRELLQRAAGAYPACAGAISARLVAAAAAVLGLLWLLPGWLAAAPVRIVEVLALLSAYHRLGGWLHSQRDAFVIAGPARLQRPALASFDEDAAMQEADALARQDPAAAAARLLPVLQGRGGSPPLRTRYRECLQAAGDRDGLLAHDRGYIAVLLALGEERQALSLYLAARQLDGGFELQEPQELGGLINYTRRTGQTRLAAALAQEYVRRFPRTRDAIAHGLAGAQLLAGLDQAAGARAILNTLLVEQPDHEARPRIAAALAGLAGA